MEDNFSLSKALDNPLFSDISFMCSDGKEVQTHQAVLAAAYPAMQKKDWEAVFRARPLDMGHFLLSCIYSDCLPAMLKIDQAQQLVEWLSEQPLLERLTGLATAFVKANNLKQSMLLLDDCVLY